MPPATAKASVSATQRNIAPRSMREAKTRMAARSRAINGARGQSRQLTRRCAKPSGRHGRLHCRRAAVAAGKHDAHQIGGIARADLFHDAGAMHLDGARTDAEAAARLLVGGVNTTESASRVAASSSTMYKSLVGKLCAIFAKSGFL